MKFSYLNTCLFVEDGLVACDECDKTFMREKNLAKHKALQVRVMVKVKLTFLFLIKDVKKSFKSKCLTQTYKKLLHETYYVGIIINS